MKITISLVDDGKLYTEEDVTEQKIKTILANETDLDTNMIDAIAESLSYHLIAKG